MLGRLMCISICREVHGYMERSGLSYLVRKEWLNEAERIICLPAPDTASGTRIERLLAEHIRTGLSKISGRPL